MEKLNYQGRPVSRSSETVTPSRNLRTVTRFKGFGRHIEPWSRYCDALALDALRAEIACTLPQFVDLSPKRGGHAPARQGVLAIKLTKKWVPTELGPREARYNITRP
jgi:hypothetical protein